MTETYDYKQLIHSPTTDYNSCLDHIYTNIDPIEGHVLESYFSDHKPIFAAFNSHT